jgi:hypothetical protein
MKAYAQLSLFMMVILMITASDSSAQGLRQRGGRQGGGLTIQRDASTDKRQDVEGTIWEFKVMDNNESNKSKRTKMTGRLRIKQTSVFAVGEVELAEKTGEPASGDEGGDRPKRFTKRGSSDDTQGELKGLLSQRINKAKQEDTGGERIGDMTKSKSSEKTFRFDEDDKHPLSGMVVVQPNQKSNGVWLGRYDEFDNGKKKKRWRFEMRKIEE